MDTEKFVLDTSVLLNFGVIRRFRVLLTFLQGRGVVTAYVCEEEVRHHHTKQALETAIARAEIAVVTLDTERELELLGRLLRSRDISQGEAETIVAAASRGWTAIIDERVATAKARALLPSNRMMDTHGVLRSLVCRRALTRAEARELNDMMRRAGRWLGEFL